MQLNTVVLPAPFGPISAVTVRSSTSKLRSSIASNPPKRMVKCSTRSKVGAVPELTMAFFDQVGGNTLTLLQKHRRLAARDKSSRPPYHDQYHGEAEDEHAILGGIEGRAENPFKEIEFAHDFGAADHDDRRYGDADLAAHAAQYHDRQDRGRFQERERFRRDKTLSRGEKRAGKAGEHRAHGKCGELGIGGVDAERAAGNFVLAERFPGAADRQPPQPHGDESRKKRQRQNDVIEEDDPVDRTERQAEHRGKSVVIGVERNAEQRGPRDAADAGVTVGQGGEID